jgi:hypothetical protein
MPELRDAPPGPSRATLLVMSSVLVGVAVLLLASVRRRQHPGVAA